MKHKQQAGFSLIEMLIVIAIIGIIAAIAIPNLLASKRAANESSAQSSLRTIGSCEATYLHTFGNGNYTDLATLGSKVMTDPTLSSGAKSGYVFVADVDPSNPALFYATAFPATTSGLGLSGTRRFGLTDDGVLRGDTDLSAAPVNHAQVLAMPALSN